MPSDRNSVVESSRNPRLKKPPACDSCKQRRVLCHPSTDGSACPRCLEKSIECKTTPVVRRKRGTVGKSHRGSIDSGTPSRASSVRDSRSRSPDTQSRESSRFPQPISGGSRTQSITPVTPLSAEATTSTLPIDQWPIPIIVELFEMFDLVPQHHHIAFPSTNISAEFRGADYKLNSLRPEARVLVMAMILSAVQISINPFVVGPGASEKTLDELKSRGVNLDLRDYGRRRKPLLESLWKETRQEAQKIGVTMHPSVENLITCHILDHFDVQECSQGPSRSSFGRPFLSAHLGHFRRLAAPILSAAPPARHTQMAFLIMDEALSQIRLRNWVEITMSDVTSLTDQKPWTLDELARRITDEPIDMQNFWQVIGRYADGITLIAIHIHEELLSPYAVRRPVSESEILKLLHSLRQIRICIDTIHDASSTFIVSKQMQLIMPEMTKQPENSRTRLSLLINLCHYVMRAGYIGALLPLHQELQRRIKLLEDDTRELQPLQRTRLDSLANEIRNLTLTTIVDILQDLGNVPSLLHITHTRIADILDWAPLLIEEAASQLVVSPRLSKALTNCSQIIKLMGFVWVDRRADALLSVIDLYLPSTPSTSSNNATPSVASFGPDHTFATPSGLSLQATSAASSAPLSGIPAPSNPQYAAAMNGPNFLAFGSTPSMTGDTGMNFYSDDWLNSVLDSMGWAGP